MDFRTTASYRVTLNQTNEAFSRSVRDLSSIPEIERLIENVKAAADYILQLEKSANSLNDDKIKAYYSAKKTRSALSRSVGRMPVAPSRPTSKGMYHSSWDGDDHITNFVLKDYNRRQKQFDDGTAERLYRKELKEYEERQNKIRPEYNRAVDTTMSLGKQVEAYEKEAKTIRQLRQEKIEICTQRIEALRPRRTEPSETFQPTRRDFHYRPSTAERQPRHAVATSLLTQRTFPLHQTRNEPSAVSLSTRRCTYYNPMTRSGCRYGSECRFAHMDS